MSTPDIEYFPIEIIVGSKNDITTLEGMKFFEFAQGFKVPYTVSVMSAHRNPDDVKGYCRDQSSRAGLKPLVFVALAGKRNDLAPAVTACTAGHRPVVAALIPNEKDPSESRDTYTAMSNMPPGTLVAWTGWDEHALKNAFGYAAQIVCQSDPPFNKTVRAALQQMIDSKPAQPQHIKFRPQETGASS